MQEAQKSNIYESWRTFLQNNRIWYIFLLIYVIIFYFQPDLDQNFHTFSQKIERSGQLCLVISCQLLGVKAISMIRAILCANHGNLKFDPHPLPLKYVKTVSPCKSRKSYPSGVMVFLLLRLCQPWLATGLTDLDKQENVIIYSEALQFWCDWPGWNHKVV